MLVPSPFNLMSLVAQAFLYSVNALLVSYKIHTVCMDYTITDLITQFFKNDM
jgi:hypothetical protein